MDERRMKMNGCPKCGHAPIYTSYDDADNTLKHRCPNCGWNNYDSCNESEKKEEKIKCPKCGSEHLSAFYSPNKLTGLMESIISCWDCGHKFNHDNGEYRNNDKEPDPNNPYTEFAKEMSLLHEALKAEGFKDAMVDILAKMTPIVWDKVERKKAHERLKAAVKDLKKIEYEPPEWIKNFNEENQKREDYNWDRIRKEVMCE
jgi:predicted RNA-binding Zn-ribbon protein involved in translation (DUF1610 family)